MMLLRASLLKYVSTEWIISKAASEMVAKVTRKDSKKSFKIMENVAPSAGSSPWHFLTLCLTGNTGVPELKCSIFNSYVSFLKFLTYLIIGNIPLKLNMEIKLNIFSTFDLLNVASIIQGVHFPNGDASFMNN